MTEAAAVPAVDAARRGPDAHARLRHLAAARPGRDGGAAAPRCSAGYRHIDTATMYGNEAEVGHALAGQRAGPRTQVFITTKLPSGKAGRERATLAASLRALGTRLRGPVAGALAAAARAHAVQVWREFLALRDEGRARAVGVSNYSLAQIDRLIKATGAGARRQPDPVEPGPVRRGRCWRTAASGAWRWRATARSRAPTWPPGADRDRRGARRDPGPGGAALASRARDRRCIPKSVHPDRIAANFDVLQLLPRPGRGGPDRPPVPLTAAGTGGYVSPTSP